jgi:hypothetical protein
MALRINTCEAATRSVDIHRGFWNFSTKLSTGPVGCCVEKSRGSLGLRQKLPSATSYFPAQN